ncbi:SLC13 family permease [Amphibiibacter pelophylacis]|uniref:SLC13 family permease n=1 Tax=Amphibiibacter pelophylacis TaxID=1799477 RepID=A0ACC6P3I7_9BURK
MPLLTTVLGLAQRLRRERFLLALLLPAVLWALVHPHDALNYPQAIDWPTLATLAALLALTQGLQSSGALAPLALRLMHHLDSPRRLALFLVLAAAALSTVLTNDVALFITVPLTLTLRGRADLPVARLVIFQAMAVNAGSLLSPIGNPQNILLWQQSGLSPAAFVAQMAPLALASLATLLALTAAVFSGQPCAPAPDAGRSATDRPLLALSCALYGLFLLALHLQQPLAGLALTLAGLAALRWRLLLKVDWPLLAVFALMFIDIQLLASLPLINTALTELAGAGETVRYLGAVGLSQLISNVPATMLLLHSQPPGALLAYAVNVGGYGFVLGSLANLIALRQLGAEGRWGAFHAWSVPLLGLNLLLGWLLLRVWPGLA